MDQKRDLEQNKVSGKLFLVGFLVLIAVIGLLLYLNPEKGNVFNGKEAKFQGVTGAEVVTGGNVITGAVTAGNQCVDVPDGLVGWWPFDESTAKQTYDFSGNGIRLSVRGPLDDEGKVDSALKFDGVDDFVGTSSDGRLHITGDMTAMWWQKVEVLTTAQQIAVSVGNSDDSTSNGNYLYHLGIRNNADGQMVFFAYHNYWETTRKADYIYSSIPVQAGVWTHVAVIRDASSKTYTFVIDGVADTPPSYSNNPSGGSTGKFVLGDNDHHNSPFNGDLDEVSIFNRALSADEILGIYNAGSKGMCKCDPSQCYLGTVDSDGKAGCLKYDANDNTKIKNCGDNAELDSCDADITTENKHPGDLSDGGNSQCLSDGKWKMICNPTNKYKLENNNKEICDGSTWRNCEDLGRSLIYDPNIINYCNTDSLTSAITVIEYNCNNGLDDDNDEKTDSFDSDCTGDLVYRLGNNTYTAAVKSWYELPIKANDDLSVEVVNG